MSLLGRRTKHWFTPGLSPVHPDGDGAHPTLGHDPRPQVPGALLHVSGYCPHGRLLLCLVRDIPRLASTLLQASVHFDLTSTYLLRNDPVCVRWNRNGKSKTIHFRSSALLSYFLNIFTLIRRFTLYGHYSEYGYNNL